MNEQIRKFAKKSGFSLDADDIYTAKLEHLPITENMEKFAELIVLECAKVAVFKDSGYIHTADVAGYMAAGRSTAARMIKEHFGVEE